MEMLLDGRADVDLCANLPQPQPCRHDGSELSCGWCACCSGHPCLSLVSGLASGACLACCVRLYFFLRSSSLDAVSAPLVLSLSSPRPGLACLLSGMGCCVRLPGLVFVLSPEACVTSCPWVDAGCCARLPEPVSRLSFLSCPRSCPILFVLGRREDHHPARIGLGLMVEDQEHRDRVKKELLDWLFSPQKAVPGRPGIGLSTGRVGLKLLGVGLCATGDGTYSGPRGLDIWPWPRNEQRLHKILGSKPKNQRPLSTLFASKPYYLVFDIAL